MMTSTGQPLFVLRGHNDAVNAIDFCDSKRLLSGAGDGKVKLWSLDQRQVIQTFSASSSSSYAIQSLHTLSKEQFVTSDREGWIKFWSLDHDNDKPLIRLYSGCQHFCKIDCQRQNGPPYHMLISADCHAMALLWDTRSGDTPIGTISSEEDRGMLTSLASPAQCKASQPMVFLGYEDGTIVAFDLRMMRPLATNRCHQEPIFDLSLIVGRDILLSGGGDPFICQTPLSQDSLSPQRLDLPIAGVSSLCGRCDGRVWAATLWDHSLRLFQTKQNKPLAVLRHHRKPIQMVRFIRGESLQSMDQDLTAEECSLMATASQDHTIGIWNLFSSSVHLPLPLCQLNDQEAADNVI